MRNSYCNGYTDREKSEDEKRRKKCGGVACQKSKSVDRVLHPCGPVTGPGVPWGFSSDKLGTLSNDDDDGGSENVTKK